MNNYIKPAIKLATTDANNNVVSCGTTADDMQLIQDIIGGNVNLNNAFGLNEGCAIKIDMYCKFTSAEVGLTRVFWS